MISIPECKPERPPSTLFKFRRFPSLVGLEGELRKRAESDRERFFELVCNGHARMALPSSFPDHFDCRAYPVDAFTDPENQRKAVLKGLEKYLRETNPAECDRFLADPGKTNFFYRNWLIFAEQTFLGIRSGIGVFSMCMVADRPAMWAMYSDGGRGVCVQLDASLPPFDLSRKVIYQDELPQYPMPIELDNPLHSDFLLQQMFQVKNTDWQHEREYRFVSAYAEGQDSILSEHGSRIDGLDLFFSPKRVMRVCIGPAMDDQTIEDLKRELAKRQCSVPIFQSEMSPREHKVVFGGQI